MIPLPALCLPTSNSPVTLQEVYITAIGATHNKGHTLFFVSCQYRGCALRKFNRLEFFNETENRVGSPCEREIHCSGSCVSRQQIPNRGDGLTSGAGSGSTIKRQIAPLCIAGNPQRQILVPSFGAKQLRIHAEKIGTSV